jgi:hypothetical protein
LGWREPIRDFLAIILMRWPDQVVFTGPGSEKIAPPEWLQADPVE